MASEIKASIITGGVNNHPTTSEEANAIATDFIPAGVVGTITNTAGVSPATGSYAVNQSGTPAMTVDISAGIAYTLGTPTGQSSQSIRSKMAATYTAYPINANTSGSTKYDWIYLKFDPTKAAAPNVDATDVINLYTSRSTSNTSDDGTPPTYGTLLAVVTVANSATSIVNANIADKRSQVLFSSSVADGTITNAKLSTTAGEPGSVYIDWTPVWTNLTVGNATQVAKYSKIGKTINAFIKLTLGSSSSVGSAPYFTLPVTPSSNVLPSSGSLITIGQTTQNPAGILTQGRVYLQSTGTALPVVCNASGTYMTDNAFSSTVPGVWATGNYFYAFITYESI